MEATTPRVTVGRAHRLNSGIADSCSGTARCSFGCSCWSAETVEPGQCGIGHVGLVRDLMLTLRQPLPEQDPNPCGGRRGEPRRRPVLPALGRPSPRATLVWRLLRLLLPSGVAVVGTGPVAPVHDHLAPAARQAPGTRRAHAACGGDRMGSGSADPPPAACALMAVVLRDGLCPAPRSRGARAKAVATSSPSTTLPDVCELGGLGTRRPTVVQTSVTSPPQDACESGARDQFGSQRVAAGSLARRGACAAARR